MPSLKDFCEALYGDSNGYVYVPTKNPATDKWKQRWFKWPVQKEDLYSYVQDNSGSKEVYISPAIYRTRKVSYESVASSRVVWAEFDGEIPTRFKGIPRPNLRIQSSTKGHEHWYWILGNPLHDTAVLSLINKKLAYELNGDKCWDVTRVLRPPTTIHHESGLVVSLLNSGTATKPVAIESFAELESPDSLEIEEITEDQIVDPEILLAVYEWSHDTYDLFKKEIPKGKRDESLTRLAFDCSEMGMADHEIVSILKAADDRWGKFVNRTDRYRRLTAILKYVRSQKISQLITETGQSSLQALGFEDFLRLKIEMKWIIKGILPVAGSAVIFGAPGCGKTTLSLRTMMAVAKGKNYLNWETLSQKRTLFVSAEMPHEELQEFFNDMDLAETAILQENFFIYPIGHAFPLNNATNKNTLLELIDKHKAEIVVLDSLSVIAGGSTNDDQVIINLNHWIDQYIRKDRGCSVLHIHHNRKPDKYAGSYQSADSLAQLYGSTFIGGGALTVVGMERNERDRATLYYCKGRYFREEKIHLIATDDRNFEVTDAPKPKSRSNSKDLDESDGNSKLFQFTQ